MNMGISKSYNLQANPPTGYLFSLWGFMLLFVAFLSTIVSPFLGLFIEASYLKYVVMIVQGALVFALPAWLVEHYYRRSHFESVWRLEWRDMVRSNFKWAVPLLLFAILASSILEALMNTLPVPDALAQLEELATREYEALLSEERWGAKLLIYLGTIVVAPLTEELFFRGAMQGWILSRSRRVHLAVWITALLFSLMHMQWSGFPSRLLLGAVMGYAAVYGGLWLAIILHVANNALVFLVYDPWQGGFGLWSGLLLVVSIVVIVIMVISMKRVAAKEATKNIEYREE